MLTAVSGEMYLQSQAKSVASLGCTTSRTHHFIVKEVIYEKLWKTVKNNNNKFTPYQ